MASETQTLPNPSETAETRAVPNPNEAAYVPILDVWRGLAISSLLIGHFAPVRGIDCGRLGVEFFFVLSGFLMGRLLFIKKTPFGLFYKRRVSRILPAAYTFLAACWLFRVACDGKPAPDWSGTLSCFLFYLNYFLLFVPSVDVGLPVVHFWSLCVEEHTYVFLSLLALVNRRAKVPPLALLGAGALACFGMAVWLGTHHGWDYYKVYWRSDTRAASIIAGAIASCLVSLGYGSRASYFGVKSGLLGSILLAIGILCHTNKVPMVLKYSLGTAVLASSLLLISQHVGGRSAIFRPLIWMGTISYSLYLWQQPFYDAMGDGRLRLSTALGGAMLAGLASYLLVERPARKRLNALWARDPAGSKGPTH